MTTLKVPANYYQQFDADYSLDVPAEGYGGWQKTGIELALEHTAVVVMHAWDCGTYEQYPGVWRADGYLPRSNEICQTVFPPLLAAVRTTGMTVFHVVAGAYYQELPGYRQTVELAGPEPEPPGQIERDPLVAKLWHFKSDRSYMGAHNRPDIERGRKTRDFPDEARPQEGEGIAENAHQLFALCREAGVNHLIYAGFAINWCILMSPGGMLDMSRRGLMCSAFRQATTAVENKETARTELAKEIALWRVAVHFGFVFDVDDFAAALPPAGGGDQR